MRARATSVQPAGPPGVGERRGAGPGRDPARALGPAGRRRAAGRQNFRICSVGTGRPAAEGPSLRLPRSRSGPPRPGQRGPPVQQGQPLCGKFVNVRA
ncbi:unnamed protein product [Pipistrellus nathusii]|uniref:Uncharacterized protein n=1 Tax=Pipistrellus nathusii TaxID=59473 RepID=A0ABN9ZCE8_PIPNA